PRPAKCPEFNIHHWGAVIALHIAQANPDGKPGGTSDGDTWGCPQGLFCISSAARLALSRDRPPLISHSPVRPAVTPVRVLVRRLYPRATEVWYSPTVSASFWSKTMGM